MTTKTKRLTSIKETSEVPSGVVVVDERVGRFVDGRFQRFEEERVGRFEDERFQRFEEERVGRFVDERFQRFVDGRYQRFEEERVGRFVDERFQRFEEERFQRFEEERVGRFVDERFQRFVDGRYQRFEDEQFGRFEDEHCLLFAEEAVLKSHNQIYRGMNFRANFDKNAKVSSCDRLAPSLFRQKNFIENILSGRLITVDEIDLGQIYSCESFFP
eukprot:Seg756.5 transcript_id=Seg756.5/GoldUCD/mRNA.D3Y31 product="Antho-RFamide neuropeptides type 2" protein_id=Seg756.5/GoldUCD/D3Y31